MAVEWSAVAGVVSHSCWFAIAQLLPCVASRECWAARLLWSGAARAACWCLGYLGRVRARRWSTTCRRVRGSLLARCCLVTLWRVARGDVAVWHGGSEGLRLAVATRCAALALGCARCFAIRAVGDIAPGAMCGVRRLSGGWARRVVGRVNVMRGQWRCFMVPIP